MAFPAQFLEVSDIGRRVRMETQSGAVIEDVITGLHAIQVDDELQISVETKLCSPVFLGGRAIKLLPDSSVQYVDEQ